MINVAVMGYGTVGSGVVEVLKMNYDSIKKRVGEEINVKYILDIRDFPNNPYKDIFTKNFDDLVDDPDVRIVAETIGGLKPAYEFTKKLLLAGKHVVTSNKELVSTHGTELLSIAKEHNVNYLFEASVGGGIPIIGPLYRCMSSNDLTEIIGILNGTTNYILTQMIKNEVKFSDALIQAQNYGYAEANPEADIEGKDACRKISILSSLMSGMYVDPEKVKTEGISSITLKEVSYAESLGCVIKLIGHSKIINGKVYAKVAPMLVKRDHPLASVEDVFNAILVKGNAVDDVMFYGRGAGMMPTASAVTSDIIDSAKHLDRNIGMIWAQSSEDIYVSPSDVKSSYLLIIKKSSAKNIKSEIDNTVATSVFIENVEDNEVGIIIEGVYDSEIESIIDKIKQIEEVSNVSKLSILDV